MLWQRRRFLQGRTSPQVYEELIGLAQQLVEAYLEEADEAVEAGRRWEGVIGSQDRALLADLASAERAAQALLCAVALMSTIDDAFTLPIRRLWAAFEARLTVGCEAGAPPAWPMGRLSFFGNSLPLLKPRRQRSKSSPS